MSERAAIVDLIEDSSRVSIDLREALISMGLMVKTHRTVQQYLASYDPKVAGCLMCSIRLPGSSGRKLQEHLNFIGASTPVVLVGSLEDMGVAVDAIQIGAFDYLELPLNGARLADCVQRAIDYDCLQRDQAQLLEHIYARVQHFSEDERRRLAAAADAMRPEPQLERFSDFMSELARIRSAGSRRLH
jgi:two-component system, LuxR family, response regulator DctR